MVAQTVPTSAWYIDKLTTVGTCSTSRGNEATRASGCSPDFHDVTEAHNVEVPKQRCVCSVSAKQYCSWKSITSPSTFDFLK